MAIEVGNLVVEMSANVARLTKDMDRARSVATDRFKQISEAADSVNKRLTLIFGSQLVGHLAGMARAGANAFSSIKHSAIDAADELNKLSQKTGFSTESLSGLKYAAQLADVSLEGLTKGLKSLSVNLVEARGGNKEMAETFRRLGISMEDPETALMQLAERFQQMPDGAQKARDAVKLFGKEGLTMIPFLNQGRDGIAELTAEAQRFGLVIDSETARQAEAFNDNLTRLKANFDGLTQQLGISMMPMLLTFTEKMLDAKTATGGVDDSVRNLVGNRARVEAFMESTLNGALMLYAPFEGLGYVFQTLGSKIALMMKGLGGLGQMFSVIAQKGAIRGWNELKEINAEYNRFREIEKEAGEQRLQQYGSLGRSVEKVFAQHRRTVRNGSQTYLMDSEEDARLLQAAIDKNYKAAGQTVKDFDTTLANSRQNAKKAADEIAQRLAAIKNANLDLDFAQVAAENEAIFARSEVLMKLQQNAVDAYAESLNTAAFAAAELQIEFNAMVAANTQAMTEAATATVTSLAEEIEGLRLRNEEIGLTAAQLDGLTQARLSTAIASKEQLYADTQLTEQNADYLAAIAEQIKLLKEKKALLGQGAAQQIQADAAKAAQDEWRRASDDIERSLTDALMRGFEGGKAWARNFADTVINTLKTAFLQPISVKISASILGAVGMGGAGTAAAAGGGGLMDGLGAISSLKSMYSAVTSGFASLGNAAGSYATLLSQGGSMGSTVLAGSQQAAMLNAQGMGGYSTSAMGGAVGSAAQYLGGAAVGYVVGKMISGGYSAIGQSGNTSVGVGTAVGMAFGPVGAMIGGAIGGLVNRAFGMGAKEVTGSGMTGTFGPSGFAGENYQTWEQKGGWFRSDKSGTETSLLAPEVQSTLSGAFADLQKMTADLAQSLNLSTTSIGAYTKSINLSMDGLDDAARQAKFDELFAEMADDMARLALQTAQYTRAGETATQTLDRLAVHLTAVNAVMVSLGRAAFATGLAGADVANHLADLAGGLEAFTGLSAGYYENFYTDAERFNSAVAGMRNQLIDIGVTAIPKTKEAFRALMEAQDLTTVSGRATYAALLNVSAGFAELTNNIEGQLATLEAERLRIAQDILGERVKLETELATLLGRTEDLRARELAQIDPLNRALYLHVQALRDVAEANAESTASLEALAGAGQGIAAFVRSLREGLSGASGAGSLASLRATYRADLTRARAGDTEASGAIVGSAGSYLDAVRAAAGSRTEYDIAASRVASQLDALPATQSYEQQQLQALADLKAGLTDLASQDRASAQRLETALVTALTTGFRTVDTNLDGLLTFDELRVGLGGVATDAQIRALITAVDLNGDGQISELESVARQLRTALATGFGSLDTNLDGLLTFDELKTGLKGAATNAQMRALIAAVDTNGDGQISELESIAAATLSTGDNTSGLLDDSDTQINDLRRLIGETISNSGRLQTLNATMDALRITISDMTAAEAARAELANKQLTLEALVDQQRGAVESVNAGISAIWSLAEQNGVFLNAQAGAAKLSNDAIFRITDDNLFQAQYSQMTLDSSSNRKGFQDAFNAAGGARDQTYGMARTLVSLKDQIDATREAIRDLGGVPQFAVGTNYVPNDMLAKVHSGERIIPAADNRQLMVAINSPARRDEALIAEIKALRADNANLRAEIRAVVTHTAKTARLLDRAMPDGDALATRVAV